MQDKTYVIVRWRKMSAFSRRFLLTLAFFSFYVLRFSTFCYYYYWLSSAEGAPEAFVPLRNFCPFPKFGSKQKKKKFLEESHIIMLAYFLMQECLRRQLRVSLWITTHSLVYFFNVVTLLARAFTLQNNH